MIVGREVAPAVAAEHRQRRAEPQVGFTAGLVGVVGELLQDDVVVRRAGNRRIGQGAQHLAGERGHRNRRAGRIQGPGARVADVDAEHAAALQRRGNGRCRHLLAVLAEAFVIAEEERPVAGDRPADHAAELVALQRRLFTRGRREIAGRVQRRIPVELPAAAVNTVRAAPVGHVDGGARRPAVLGALVVGHDLELVDGIGRRLHHLVGEALVAGAVGVVVDAVDEKVVERTAQAVDVEGAFAQCAGAAAEGRLAHAGRQ